MTAALVPEAPDVNIWFFWKNETKEILIIIMPKDNRTRNTNY